MIFGLNLITLKMKKSALFLALIISASLTFAQKAKTSEVPSAVKNSFSQKFPGAKEVKWSKENAAEYEAEFEIGRTEQTASFDPAGKWLETETEIKNSEIPGAVQATIKNEFAGYKMSEPEKLEAPDKGISFEMELKKDKITYEVQFAMDGKILKKKEKKTKAADKD